MPEVMVATRDVRHMRGATRQRQTGSMHNLLLVIHIVTGSIALGTMIVPLAARKGGPAHRRAGWIFVAGMAFATATAFVMSLARLLTDPSPGGRSFALLLFYLSIVTGTTVSAGVRELRSKHRTAAGLSWWDIAPAATLAACGMLAAAYGIAMRQPLFVGFSAVGIFSGVSGVRYWMRAPSCRMHWWYAHMGNMLGGCIAAITAFTVTNARLFGVPGDSVIVWLGPTAVGVPAIFVWIGYYRRKFERAGIGGGRTRPTGMTVQAGSFGSGA
jgi:hypothetical protein